MLNDGQVDEKALEVFLPSLLFDWKEEADEIKAMAVNGKVKMEKRFVHKRFRLWLAL